MYLIDPLIGHTAAPNSGQSFRYPVGIGQSEEGLREEGLRWFMPYGNPISLVEISLLAG
jgi:hypothetical protein